VTGDSTAGSRSPCGPRCGRGPAIP
jgi:hypothetical protein